VVGHQGCSVVRISLKSISCACSERPDVWMWYFSFCERSSPPYSLRIATARFAGHAADYRVLRIEAGAEEEAQVRSKVIDLDPTAR